MFPAIDLQYPIGKFQPKETYTSSERNDLIQEIQLLPERVAKAIQLLDPTRLDTPYREGGWTVRQVVHHIADSHMNAYIRFKWTLTENTPTIKAYLEKIWAETAETTADPQLSIALLKPLHEKWVVLLRSLTDEQLMKEFTHPETGKKVRLDRLIALYAWHGNHHLGHIRLVV